MRKVDEKFRLIMPTDLVTIYQERGFGSMYCSAENGNVIFRDHIEKDFDKFYRTTIDSHHRTPIAESIRTKVDLKPRDIAVVRGMGDHIQVSRTGVAEERQAI